MPIWVALRLSSSWISGMTGGTANMVRRSALPASHSSSNEVSKRACDGAPWAFCIVETRHFSGCYGGGEILALLAGEIP
jgi:hypothetical protein